MEHRALFPFLTVLFFIFLLAGCRERGSSNLGVDQWHGKLLSGESVHFADIKAPGLVINFYSPTCGPCIEELPALNLLYDEARKAGIPMYIVVEGWPEPHDIPISNTAAPQVIFEGIKNRMERDVEKYGIRVPIVVLDQEFKLDPSTGLITGTPETLIFNTDPLILRYNFVGAISEEREAETILQDPAYRFAVEMVRGNG